MSELHKKIGELRGLVGELRKKSERRELDLGDALFEALWFLDPEELELFKNEFFKEDEEDPAA